jgi:hypothetical protein
LLPSSDGSRRTSGGGAARVGPTPRVNRDVDFGVETPRDGTDTVGLPGWDFFGPGTKVLVGFEEAVLRVMPRPLAGAPLLTLDE